MINKKRFRLRIIIPAFPEFNIYTYAAKSTTSVGPLYVATAAAKLHAWDVEVIDENNCNDPYCPKAFNKLPDHEKLQEQRPADVVGFYGSISTSIPRLYELSKLYKEMGAKTIAGGKHIENLPEEALDNNVDIIFFGEAEESIVEYLYALENERSLTTIGGIGYRQEDKTIITDKRPLINDFESFPYPDFSLLRYAKIKYHPVNRIRGCNMKCEFCAVKDRTRCSSPEYMMGQIRHLVETRNARYFFDVSDHFAADRQEAIKFCKLLAEYQKEIGKRLYMTVQTRITDARYPELLQAMKDANIGLVCIGYESPIDEELIAMRKGYLSKDLIELTNRYHTYGFFIHAMFIFGYPQKVDHGVQLTLEERVKRFKTFIRKARLDTVQILLTVPLPGTDLRKRLEKEGRLYSIDDIGWQYYDGQFPLYQPDNGVSPLEMQKAVGKIMSRFYHFRNFWKIVQNIMINFPVIVFTAAFTIVTFRVKYIVKAFKHWKKRYFRNYVLRFGGYIIIKSWLKKFNKGDFTEKLQNAREKMLKQANNNILSKISLPEVKNKQALDKTN